MEMRERAEILTTVDAVFNNWIRRVCPSSGDKNAQRQIAVLEGSRPLANRPSSSQRALLPSHIAREDVLPPSPADSHFSSAKTLLTFLDPFSRASWRWRRRTRAESGYSARL